MVLAFKRKIGKAHAASMSSSDPNLERLGSKIGNEFLIFSNTVKIKREKKRHTTKGLVLFYDCQCPVIMHATVCTITV